ncbi:uncharacterized protein LOC135488679 [Lineus longissimus]|uniref:uncharacterized protein LOC135488679 n=1 Tax=Lineus longissimus TaxID=88925 RepID=UPI002B4CFFEA
MTSARSPANTKMDKSLVVNMLKFEATTRNSHLPPIARSVAEEMTHKTEARVRAKPALKAVPDTVKLYQKMKKRGIFTVGLSADSKVEDNSFKIETKGFNLSNVPDNLTYTRAKNKDEVWVDVKKDRPRKERRCQDDGLMWPKYTRNNTMILPKLSYGVDRKKMKPLVPVELEVNGTYETEMTPAHDQEEKATKPGADAPETVMNGDDASHENHRTETSSINVSLISIGQDQKPPDKPDSNNKSEEDDNTQSAPAPVENSKEIVTPTPTTVFSPPILRQVTIGVDIPEPNPDTKNKKEIRSMYPMYDSNEDRKEKQRQNWWERQQRSPMHSHKPNTNIPLQQQNRQNATMFLAPIPKAHTDIRANSNTERTKENIKIVVPNKEYVNADEMQRNNLPRRSSDDYLNLPGVFEKHLEVVKTIAQSRSHQAKSVNGQIDLSPRVTGLSQATKSLATSTPPVTSVPPPSAATVALTDEGTFHKMESTVEGDSVSLPESVAPSIKPNAEPVARVEIAISGSRILPRMSPNDGDNDQENSAVLGTGLTVNVGGGDSVQSLNSDNHPHLSHHESLSAHSRYSGHEDDVRPSGPRRRTSSFLELPQSPIDPGERPPSTELDAMDIKETVSPSARDQSAGGHQTPRRRTSSFLEPPGSQCDPLERPPSKSDSVDFNPEEDSVFGEQSPRLSSHPLSRRPTPEILVSTEAEELEVPHLKDG